MVAFTEECHGEPSTPTTLNRRSRGSVPMVEMPDFVDKERSSRRGNQKSDDLAVLASAMRHAGFCQAVAGLLSYFRWRPGAFLES